MTPRALACPLPHRCTLPLASPAPHPAPVPLLQVTEKFRLDLTNEEAARFFQELINDSVSALSPQMVETIHRWAQYWRA